MPDAPVDDTGAELLRAQETIAYLETRIGELNGRLLDAERGKSSFVSRALNELTNPLCAMIGLSEQLLEGNPAHPAPWEDLRESLHYIHEESVGLQFQLRNLLMAAELESGQARSSPCQTDLCGVLNQVTAGQLPAARAKGLRITRNGGPPLQVGVGKTSGVCIDARLLGLIYANLLDNAIKSSPRSACIAVSCEVDDTSVHLAVADDGPGLHGHEARRAFDRFWQGDESTTRSWRGLGLGLAVAAGCAVVMGGRLSIDAGATRGACLRLTVPRQSEDDLFYADGENLLKFSGDEDDAEACQDIV